VTTWNGTWHPFAERFPMLSEQELRDMAESIKEIGQTVPCVMNSDGLGIDGRNRVAACRIAGVEPQWTVNDGNPYSVINSANVHTRTLTTGQRAMAVALELVEKGLRQDNGRWKRGAVAAASEDISDARNNNWGQSVSQAGIILDHLGDAVNDVLAGKLPLETAYQRADAERKRSDGEAAERKERQRRIDALPNDLAALVDGGVRDLDDAEQEAEHRATVAEVDEIRDGDNAPPPTFAERVESGALSWSEAAKLADEWRRERDESIARDVERARKVTDGWAAVRFIAEDPDHPYAAAVLGGLEPSRRDALMQVIEQLRSAA
jgi:hypothetical protein